MSNIINFLTSHIKEIIYCIIAIFITVLGISCLLARARDEIYSSTAIKIINELDKQGYIIKPSTTKYVLKPSH